MGRRTNRVHPDTGEEAAWSLSELVCLDDLELLYRVKHALEARGLDALVSGDPSSWSFYRRRRRTRPRLLVRRCDLAYARWVADAVGVDCWTE